MTLGLSTARADITPTAMAEMGGYGTSTGPRLATGTYSPLMARVLVLWDPAPHVIVTLDAGTIPPAWHQALRPRLVALGPASSDIAVLCTHTHNGPMTLSHPDPWITYGATDLGPATAYWDALADTVVALVADALAAPQIPVTLDYQSTTQNWSDSRTQPYTYKWTNVPVLALRDAAGQPRAVLFGFGCHAVTAGLQTRWDGDYPAAAVEAVEASVPGCHAQFMPGPGGDQNPVGSQGWRVRDERGAQLASAVVTALATVGRPLVGPISSTLTSVTVPLDVPTDAERPARRAEYGVRIPVPPAPNPFDAEPWVQRHAVRAVAQIDAGTDPRTITVPIQVCGGWALRCCGSS